MALSNDICRCTSVICPINHRCRRFLEKNLPARGFGYLTFSNDLCDLEKKVYNHFIPVEPGGDFK